MDVIPRDAWLEAVVNAVVHRSYSMAGDHIRVSIFPHRIEVSSPGRFPGPGDPSRPLEIARYARNPRIARVCADLGITQELGEGIRRMVEDMRQAGLADPRYRQTSTSVVVRLDAVSALSSDIAARMPPGALEIISLLRSTGPLSTGEIASGMDAARPTVLRWLKSSEGKGSWNGVGSRRATRGPHGSFPGCRDCGTSRRIARGAPNRARPQGPGPRSRRGLLPIGIWPRGPPPP